MDAQFDADEILRNLYRDLVRSIDVARGGSTPGEVGDDIERSIRASFSSLGDLMPPGLAVGTGFVVDSFGNRSKQTDIIIYEKEKCRPIFRRTPDSLFSYYPCEGVVAAGEVKSRLTKQEFEVAIDKAASVKSLKRAFETCDKCGHKCVIGRRYTSDDVPDLTHHIALESGKADILYFVLAGDTDVRCETLLKYYSQIKYNERVVSIPEVLVSMRSKSHPNGNAVLSMTYPRPKSSPTLAAMRQASGVSCVPSDNPLKLLIHMIFRQVEVGWTTPDSAFQRYMNTQLAMHRQYLWSRWAD